VDLEAVVAARKAPPYTPESTTGTRRKIGGVGRPFTGRQMGTSWWTARATSGEVTSGFTKEEMLRKPKQNPRAEGGMFSRLEELLVALAGPR
jgi:hypothetical protein